MYTVFKLIKKGENIMNKAEAQKLIDRTKALKKEINAKDKTYKANVVILKKYYLDRKIGELSGSKYSLSFSEKKNETIDVDTLLRKVGDIKTFLTLVSPKKTDVEKWLQDSSIPRNEVITTNDPIKFHKANFKVL